MYILIKKRPVYIALPDEKLHTDQIIASLEKM